MTITEQYTRAHAAFQTIARKEKMQPFEVRVLVAVSDLGPCAVRSDWLEEALGNEGSATRRALSNLYRSGHAVGVAVGGGRRRQGVRSMVSLTTLGQHVVALVAREIIVQQAAA